MAETVKDGGPAFPHSYEAAEGHPNWRESQGMTLRDWFAGKALMGLIADPNEVPDADQDHDEFYAQTAETAYALADAMLEARSK